MGDHGPLSVAELCRLVEDGRSFKYLYFWGHQAARDGRIGPSCLSQWWPCEFTVDGVTYFSAEHWMMAEKARLFKDEETLARILATKNPAQVKVLGRKVSPFDEDTWAEHREDIVAAGSAAKFGQNPELGDFLRTTGNRVLVEASPLDRISGIGLAQVDKRAGDPRQWEGLNLLGFALMRARADI